MLTLERQSLIVDMLQKKGMVRVAELMKTFSVSGMTIRRDLDTLEKEGILKKVYGGAIATTQSMKESSQDIPIYIRSIERIQEKRNIAQFAVSYIAKDDAILLDAGTTTLEIAKLLKDRSSLVLITNSIPVAHELAGSDVTLLIMGGQIRGSSHSIIGAKAKAFLSDIVVGTVFLAASGLSLDQGIMNSNLDESEVKCQMINHSEKVILVADSSKFQSQSYHVFAQWNEIDVFITDDQLPDEYYEILTQLGLEVIRVPM
ncbi:MAG: DeoR/GlpR family DNA-binding transcription regulator [Acidibacillus sp.]|nr:DeoR/GlpR family DNA-binding transcription regulator [Acidibacillus sp.]